MGLKGFKWEARAPQEESFVAQKCAALTDGWVCRGLLACQPSSLCPLRSCSPPAPLPLPCPPHRRWGLTARDPGASATLRFDSDLGGLSRQRGARVMVHLLYLRSYQGMGRARVECGGGCACDAADLDAHWDRQATLTDLTTLQAPRWAWGLLGWRCGAGCSSRQPWPLHAVASACAFRHHAHLAPSPLLPLPNPAGHALGALRAAAVAAAGQLQRRGAPVQRERAGGVVGGRQDGAGQDWAVGV